MFPFYNSILLNAIPHCKQIINKNVGFNLKKSKLPGCLNFQFIEIINLS